MVQRASVISTMADKLSIDLSSEALTGMGSKVTAVQTAQERTAGKLDLIRDMKGELCKQIELGAAANSPSFSNSSRHAIPEAESRFMRDMTFDAAMAGIGFAVAGPAGVAAAGVIGAIQSAGALMTGSSQQHQGTIHFGERGVQGGELNDPVASSTGHGKQADTYIDVMGGAQNNSAGYKPPAPQAMPVFAMNDETFGTKKETEMAAAAREALVGADAKQVMSELGGNSEAEKRLTNDLYAQRKLMAQGGLDDMSPDKTLAGADTFDSRFQAFKAPPTFKMAGSVPRMG